jgi:diaminopimelate epimerase
MWDFIKYHGLGNDFVLLDGGLTGRSEPPAAVLRAICGRGTGVGADGVMLARSSARADLAMTLINSDGTVPEMCGNGLRCLVKHAVDDLGFTVNPLRVETGAGVLACSWRRGADGTVDRVEVAMGPPTFARDQVPVTGQGDALDMLVQADGRTWRATGVGTGNPHMVIFGDASVELATTWGPVLTSHPMWPQGTNVEFTQLLSPTHLKVTVWERGCGLTQACGTGATAAAAAAVRLGHSPSDTPIKVTLPGGDLTIRVAADFHDAWMDGPAVEVYRGQLPPLGDR